MPLKVYQVKSARVNVSQTYKFKCTLKKGKYELDIAGRDQAGNWCAKSAVVKLTVK